MVYNIAIDGPSGAGKSTLARAAAKKIGFIYVDTGALYRAIGLHILNNNINPENEEEASKELPKIEISIRFADGSQHVILNGKDVSEDIRIHKVSDYTSKVSAYPKVREFLLETQRKIAKEYNVIMDGRDIGTVVLPDAQVKIFLTASAQERAMRRYRELIDRGQKVDFDTVLHDVVERDSRDMNREIAPLKPSDDAVVIDTTGNTFEKSLQILIDVIGDAVK